MSVNDKILTEKMLPEATQYLKYMLLFI